MSTRTTPLAPLELVPVGPMRLLIEHWQLSGGRLERLPGTMPRICRRILSGGQARITFDAADRIATALGMVEWVSDLYPAPPRTERAGFAVNCPECGTEHLAVRPVLPFRHATPDSVFGPPTYRPEPKRVDARRICRCEHCESEYRPARNTRNPRFCSKSCARRYTLARKHGFVL